MSARRYPGGVFRFVERRTVALTDLVCAILSASARAALSCGKPIVLKLGYKASAEQFGPNELLQFSRLAEQAGFDSVFISDHFQPWKHHGGHAAKRELADKYGDFGVQPQQGSGSITVGGVAGNRLPRGDRTSGDLEPPALGRRNRLDLERRRERPRRLRNVPQLHLRGWVEERRKGRPTLGDLLVRVRE